MKWIEVGDESNWDQVRNVFEPLAQRLRSVGLRAEVLIRRGKPADQILEEADTWGADVSSSARKEPGVLTVCYLVACPPPSQVGRIARSKS